MTSAQKEQDMHSRLERRLLVALMSFLTLSIPALAVASGPVQVADNLADMSLEELSNLQVTTAAKRAEKLSDVPASVYVITGDDIRRSGATNLGQALQLAPNLEVAQVNSENFAVSSRGFLNLVTNKLLVLIDGRTVYSPVLSGVFWNVQQVMLEDVDRIEVISGPGAALEGANAFDGVINIITKSAADTLGGVAIAAGGNNQRDYQLRYGAPLGDAGAFRIYAMHTDDFGTTRTDGASEDDDMRRDQAGFRYDYSGAAGDHATLQGDIYQGTIGSLAGSVEYINGANLLGRYAFDLHDGSRITLQSYIDHAEQIVPRGLSDTFDVFDIEIQDDLARIGDHNISLGGGYRTGYDQTPPTEVEHFIPQNRTLYWSNIFAQDQYALTQTLTATLGLKIETDVYTSPQYMPDVRLAWKPAPDHLLWAAASRAVRTPARVDRDFYFPSQPPYLIRGNSEFQPETGDIYELGYRAQPSGRFSYSVTAYYNQLDNLRSGQPSPLGGFVIANGMSGYGTGLEMWGNYQALDNLRLSFGVDEIRQNLHRDAGSLDPTGPSALGNDPRHMVKLRATYTISPTVELNAAFRYVSQLAYLPQVPAYNATDFNLRWRATPKLDLSFAVLDAFHAQHVEWEDSSGAPGVIPREFLLTARYSF
jgi:iron complex outermembrane receptor protein